MDITPTTVVVVMIVSISQPLPHTVFGGFIQSFVDIDTAHHCYNTSQMLVRQTRTAEEEAGIVEPHSITTTAILPSQLYKLIVLISMFTM
jgi:hypothetical protein